MLRTSLSLSSLVVFFLLLWVGQPAHAINTSTVLTLNAVSGNTIGTQVDVKGWTTATFHIVGTFSGIVKFVASGDNVNGDPIACVSLGAPLVGYVTQTSSHGLFRCNIIAINGWLRADVSDYVSGTITVTIGLASAGVT